MKILLNKRQWITLFFLLIFGNGCVLFSPDKKYVVIKKGESGYVHSVSRKNESLEMIAHWYTGKPDNASQLARVNPGIDPENIVPGTAVFIPGELLVTTEIMPKNRLNESIRRRSFQKGSVGKDRVPKQGSEKEKEEFELFGPR